jgi:hypothetical protein
MILVAAPRASEITGTYMAEMSRKIRRAAWM